jgi:hypothetical protein
MTLRRMVAPLLAVAVALFAPCHDGASRIGRAGRAPVKIVIRAVAAKIVSGRGLDLKLTITSLLNRKVTIQPGVNYFHSGPGPFDLSVVGPNGAAPRATSFSDWLASLGGPTASLAFSRAGNFTSDIMLTRYYDLTLTGKYTVQASLIFPGTGRVTSNRLTVEVTVPGASGVRFRHRR